MSRISSAPVWPRAPTMPIAFDSPIASVRQGGGTIARMRDAMPDVGELADSVPEYLPLRQLDAAVALAEVERIDRVAATRAPEQARRLLAHDLPDRAADALTLRLVEHGELVEVGLATLLGQDQGRAIILADIGAQQARAFEVAGQQ